MGAEETIMEDSIYNVEQIVVAVKLTPAQNEVSLEQATLLYATEDVEEVLSRARRVKLFNGRYEPSNFFSFPLPSGDSAIGRLIPQRGKPIDSGEFFLQCLVVSSEVFYNCGADPIRLVLHALNTTYFSAYCPGRELKRFSLEEPLACANLGEVRRTSKKIGSHTLAVLIQALLQYEQTYFVADYHASLIVSNVFSLLPVFSRLALSFSVGLFFKDDNSTNLVGVTLPKRIPFRCRETLEAESFLDLRDVAENGSEYAVDSPWAKLVENMLNRNLGDSFFYKIARNFLDEEPSLEGFADSKTRWEEVEELGEEWREFFDSDSADKLEGFDAFSISDDSISDDESEFGFFNDRNVKESDSDGEEWKQGYEYDAEGFEERLTTDADENERQEGDQEDGQEDESLHKVRFFEIPKNLDDVAPDSSPERASRIDQDGAENAPSSQEVARFLEARLSPQALRDEATRRANGDLLFPPFVLLSAEYPEKNVALRTLDTLIFCALSGNSSAKRDFARVWEEFCATTEKETTDRARELYFLDLLNAVKNYDGIAREAREEQLANILELATIMAR